MTEPKKKVGRPSKKGLLDLEMVRKLASKGWTDLEMADFFGVASSTWYKWLAEDEDFSEALKGWKAGADARVVRSLYERACGFEHADTHIAVHQGEVIQTPVRKKYPPDTAAAIFWLKNRDKENWRDQQNVGVAAQGPLAEFLASLSAQRPFSDGDA